MNTVVYNGIPLPFAETETGEYRTIYSEDGAEYRFTEVTYTINSLLTADIPGLLLPGETLAMAFRRIQHALEQPCKPLLLLSGVGITVEARRILYVNDADKVATRDLNHGPKPQVLSIVSMAGDASIHVRFTVKTWISQCTDRNPPKYISHRWEDSVVIGDDLRTTLTRTGKLVVRPGTNPDELRHIVTPPIPEKFVHVSARYVRQSDGLALIYEIVRQEVARMPPAPAVKAESKFAILSGKNGAQMWGVVSVRLTGHVRSNNRELLGTAIQIAIERIKQARPQADKDTGAWKINQGRVEEDVYNNVVEVSLQVLLMPPREVATSTGTSHQLGQIIGGLTLTAISPLAGLATLGITAAERLKEGPQKGNVTPLPKGLLGYGFGLPPKFSEADALPPDPGMRATAGIVLMAAALNDPCLRDSILKQAPSNPDIASGEGVMRGGPGTAVPRPGIAFPPPPSPRPSNGGTQSVSSMSTGNTSINASFIPGSSVVASPMLASSQFFTTPTIPNAASSVSESPAPPISIYSDFQIETRYLTDHNISATPEQKEDGLTHFTQLSAPTTKIEVIWACEGVGEVIEVPQSESPDPNIVLLEDNDTIGAPEPMSDGYNYRFSASGRYVYGVVDPSKLKKKSAMLPHAAWLLGLAPKAYTLDGPELVKIKSSVTTQTSELTAVVDPAGLAARRRGGNLEAIGSGSMFEAWRDSLAQWVAVQKGKGN